MGLVENIKQAAVNAIRDIFQHDFPERDILVNVTKPEFEGDYTVVVFPFTRFSRKSPGDTGKLIGDHLMRHGGGLFVKYNVEKGFLNLTISDQYWIDFLALNGQNKRFGFRDQRRGKVMVEYSSPNTNKPLHLGHLRNNFLGASISSILEANGYEVIQANLVNDRGIHICKSMIAWQMFGKGATPQSTGIKGDHLVGDYYVKFNEEYKRQVEELTGKGMEKEQAEKEAPVMKAAQEMLLQWEQHDPAVRQLWATMNGWVYEGFDTTYKRLGIRFDKLYYESETYLLGKKVVEEGLL
ncbi:MAG TPA: arginine--tRNA ligase, partial [Chitinophagaceae bacterium]